MRINERQPEKQQGMDESVLLSPLVKIIILSVDSQELSPLKNIVSN